MVRYQAEDVLVSSLQAQARVLRGPTPGFPGPIFTPSTWLSVQPSFRISNSETRSAECVVPSMLCTYYLSFFLVDDSRI